MKHTKEYWRLVPNSGEIVTKDEGFYVARVVSATTTKMGKANAHLIASAPELLDVLRDVLDDLEIGAHPHLHIDAIRHAIAKAEGK